MNKNNDEFLKPLLIFRSGFSPSFLLLFPSKRPTASALLIDNVTLKIFQMAFNNKENENLNPCFCY